MTAREAREISNKAKERIAKRHAELAEALSPLFLSRVQRAAENGLFSTTVTYNGMVESAKDYTHLFTDGVTVSSFLDYMAEYLKNFGYETATCKDQRHVNTALTIGW